MSHPRYVAAGSEFEFRIFKQKYGIWNPQGDSWIYLRDTENFYGWGVDSYIILFGTVMNNVNFDRMLNECQTRRIQLIDLTEELHGHGRISTIPEELK
jgi:hypothetical protein